MTEIVVATDGDDYYDYPGGDMDRLINFVHDHVGPVEDEDDQEDDD